MWPCSRVIRGGYVKSRLAENSQFVVYSTDNPDEGRVAVTHYEVLGRGNNYTLAHFSPDTGRKNQIREHAHDLGHTDCRRPQVWCPHQSAASPGPPCADVKVCPSQKGSDMNSRLRIPPKFAAANPETVEIDNQTAPDECSIF